MNIDISTVQNFCANSCFVVLFITTLYYWAKTIFSSDFSYTPLGLIGYGTALFCLTTQLILRWLESGHFPLSNLYESLIFLSWSLLLFHIYLENSMKNLFLGVLTAPAILCLIAFTDFSLPTELQKSNSLVPALQSNWLVMHVTVMIGSYAALLLGSLIAISYIIFSEFFFKTKINLNLRQKEFLDESQNLKKESDIVGLNSNSLLLTNSNRIESSFFQENLEKSNQILNFLDNLSYRTIGIGFCLLTLGILSGAVWANETWGNYWSWDPKETWAFITWLTFATYLHSRLIGGWDGLKPALIASFGFVIVWICYLGVNLLGQGLHSYGFLKL